MKISIIAGARPNFMKIAPIIHAIKKAHSSGHNLQYRLIHTGQHYDEKMSDTFFKELNIPHPDANLNCGGGTQAEQTAAILVAFEKELLENPADLVLVVGDVTSTMACAIVAKKLNTKVAHVEAGIRSFDLTMPEEINRMVTDSITDYFFTTSTFANDNLKKSGISESNIFFTGNVMIDTLNANRSKLRKPAIFDENNLEKGKYLVMTLHRPANVDEGEKLKALIDEIVNNVEGLPIIFPIHPRTAKIFSSLGIEADNLLIVEPLGYLEFNYLVENCKAVITDSGGITEETTVMGVPCITLRANTERPETVSIGTNELIGVNPEAVKPALAKLFAGDWKKGGIPELWDGHAAERIVDSLLKINA
ncbi:UDP-N-acetylglucosamine 2-epimerase (non-hydrolyzing) [Flavobacterium sp. J372]|uniref:non-hydrolyzing UDP-N-acetylglucosamine 2-epimerase n=1 Tax=Flavobacterium sp. J372 TaxID=2898436 RepID=UPI002150FBDA|nr:UDP-N-acetylglucosamine 2-epimerase (non-hydrolyzing) [Flavobacterium sp. J372]MCR5861693.1 UDP-N-acetylglucosamine 2-epimerase (non-hydrolyzing) [Flavobacterium sp. J372]